MNNVDSTARYYFAVWKEAKVILDFTVNKYGKYVLTFRRSDYGNYVQNDHCTVRIPTNLITLSTVTGNNIKKANEANYFVFNGIPTKVTTHEEYVNHVKNNA